MSIRASFNTATPARSYLDFGFYGRGFAQALAKLSTISDLGRGAYPPEWPALAALLCTLIQDEGMTPEMASFDVAVPVWLGCSYRAAMCN